MDTNLVVYMAIVFSIVCGAEAYSDYTHSECAKAYATSNRTGDEIAKICHK
jgi:hypothetical protein